VVSGQASAPDHDEIGAVRARVTPRASGHRGENHNRRDADVGFEWRGEIDWLGENGSAAKGPTVGRIVPRASAGKATGRPVAVRWAMPTRRRQPRALALSEDEGGVRQGRPRSCS